MARVRTAALRDADAQRLHGLHPHLADVVTRVLDAMAAYGAPMFITAGLRTDAQQAALYAQGRTTPGAIVTNTDGVLKKSMHQMQVDGFGHAVDCAFIDDPDTKLVETWDASQPWELYGHMGEQGNLVWGGRWLRLVDRPHLELSLSAKI